MRYFTLCSLLFSLAFADVSTYISTPYAYCLDADSGSALYEKNSEEFVYPASTTKIATALYVVEKIRDLSEKVICSDRRSIQRISPKKKAANHFTDASYLLEYDGVIFGLRYNEELSVNDLLHILLLKSANDAANVLAEHVSGSVESFCEELNTFLLSLGMSHTHFNNPHGLHHPEHVTTAKDMALLAQHALKNEVIRRIISTPKYTVEQTNIHAARDIVQTNKLLIEGPFHYEHAYGLKTGNHRRAGKCLLACAKHNNRDIIVGMFKARDWNTCYSEAISLFDALFQEKKVHRFLFREKEQQFTHEVQKRRVQAYLNEDILVDYYPSESPRFVSKLHWNEVSFPIHEGQEIGTIRVYKNDMLAYEKALVAVREYEREGYSTLFLGSLFMLVAGVIALAYALGLLPVLRTQQ